MTLLLSLKKHLIRKPILSFKDLSDCDAPEMRRTEQTLGNHTHLLQDLLLLCCFPLRQESAVFLAGLEPVILLTSTS